MRFYGICILMLTAVLIVLPLLTQENQPQALQNEEVFSEEKPLVALVSDWEQQPLALPKVEQELSKVHVRKKQLQIKNASTGKNERMDLEDFVKGAVCSEMPATFHIEALKAQAVSARTWACYQQQWQEKHPDPKLSGADFQSDPDNWKGYVTKKQAKERFQDHFEEWWGLIAQAAEETKGQIMCWEDEPIAAAYHAISPGRTEDAYNVWGRSIPYLKPVPSRGDQLAPGYEETKTVSQQEMKELLKGFGAVLGDDPSTWIKIESRSPGGFVLNMTVGGAAISGLNFREKCALRSSCFTIDYRNGTFSITTQGYGHGVGLSQYGADFMARQGSSYQEILEHYYPGAKLCQMN